MNPDDTIATRETLLERLRKRDDHAGWQEFFDLYWRLIHRVAIKAGLEEDEAHEVVHGRARAATTGAVARVQPDPDSRPNPL